MHLKWYPGCTETISKIVLTDSGGEDSLPSECRSLQHLSWYTGARKRFTCLSRKCSRIQFSIYVYKDAHKVKRCPFPRLDGGNGRLYTSKVHGSLSRGRVRHQLHKLYIHHDRTAAACILLRSAMTGGTLGRKYNRFLCSRKITVQRVVQLDL